MAEMTRSGGEQPAAIRVLFVEDEALIRISAVDFLEDSGLSVIEAGTAAQALAACSESIIDIVVTDVHLPDMTGLALILKLREERPDLPVIFATGDRNLPEAEGLAKAMLLSKPYDYDHLIAVIRSMISN
jgi:DNA-binding NtrC family response regulator